jgi:lysophospholipase L1-like esterase
MAAFAAEKILAGELTFTEFAKDGVHPTDRGYALYFDALKPFIAQCKTEAQQTGEIKRHALPEPLSPAPMEQAQCVEYTQVKLDGPWKLGRSSPVKPFLHVLESDQPEAMLTVRFKGSQCGLFDAIGPDTGDLEVSVDGGEWKPKKNWDHYAKGYTRAHSTLLAQNLDPAQWHEVKLRVAEKQPAESNGRFVRIGYLLVDGEVEDPLKALDPLQRIDAVWKTIEQPLKVQLSPDRWQHIPETIKRLKEGTPLRIVMLGDSIVGDTSSSKYELLLQRLYPEAKIEKILSNRGSTGCWWYKDENRVEDYVLKHRPDLLMIGGISNRDDTEAIRSVIQQVRARMPEVEVLLMTPAFGTVTDPHVKNWRYEIVRDSGDYRARLMRVAEEEKCAFLDMTGPWWQFVQDSGSDYGYFRRDAVHANERGFQILGRTLEKFFAP